MPTHHRVISSATHRYLKSESDQQESTGQSVGLRKKKTLPAVGKEAHGCPVFLKHHPVSARLDAGLLARATGLSELFFRFFHSFVCLLFYYESMSRPIGGGMKTESN